MCFLPERRRVLTKIGRKDLLSGGPGSCFGNIFANWAGRKIDVYITNIIKRRPPENRDPSPEEIESYKPYLARQIELLVRKSSCRLADSR